MKKKVTALCKSYKFKASILVLALIFITVFISAHSMHAGQPAETGSTAGAMVQPQTITKNDTCAKCNMYPANYPQWQSQIVFKDDTMASFDGCKCMFNFMNAMEAFDQKHTADDVAAVYVKDFKSGKWLNGTEAYYVVGSRKMGPMGKQLIPFAKHEDAMKFHEEQGGSVMQYSQITPPILKALRGM
jgi:nitrous oxide reductase accessory protein NosL